MYIHKRHLLAQARVLTLLKSSNKSIDPVAIITRIYPIGSRTRDLLLRHGEVVGRKAIEVLDRAPWLDADR